MLRVLFLLVALLGISCQPKITSIRTDGVLTPEEWNGAEEFHMGDSVKLLMRRDREALCVALVHSDKIWAHSYLSDGNRIQVMHASAALDEVNYTIMGSRWSTEDEFQYELRDTVINNETQVAMDTFYTKHGWVANNIHLGDGKTIEFKINNDHWNGELYFAAVLSTYDMQFSYFPLTLRDDTLLPRLVQGYAPDSLHFEPRGWMRIR